MSFKRAIVPVASGKQRKPEQQKIDRVVWQSWQLTLSGEDGSFMSDPMTEAETADFAKKLVSSSVFFKNSRGANFRVKSEFRDAIEEIDESTGEVMVTPLDDGMLVVVFCALARNPRSKGENGEDEDDDDDEGTEDAYSE